jgi:integrase
MTSCRAGDLTVNHNRFQIAPVTNSSEEICAPWTNILGLSFVLVLETSVITNFPQLANAVFRPRLFAIRHPSGSPEILLTWVDGNRLRLLVAWAIRENLIKRADNPASDMEKNLPKKRKKDRMLSLDEVRIVWRAAVSAGFAFGTHVPLMLLTGCRAGEWAHSVRSWVDMKQRLRVIPAEA